jgi:undecaprenyl-diphosphatase
MYPQLLSIDLFLTRYVNGPAGHHPIVDNLMIALTEFTVPVMVLAVAIRWWSRVGREEERNLAVETGLSFVAGLLINQAILLFVSRIRPYELGITYLIVLPSADPSFPSDHATASIAIVAAMWLNHHARRALLFAIPAALLLLSRVYVGTHYVSDVIGGAGSAIAAATLVRATARARAPLTAKLIRFP